MYAAYAILGALYERETTGKGRRLEVNMLESSMAFIQDIYTNYTRAGRRAIAFSASCARNASRSTAPTARCSPSICSTGEKFWSEMVKAIGLDHLIEDERFAKHVLRVKNYVALEEILAERFLSKTRAEWIAGFQGADVPYAPINDIAEAVADPQVAALGTMAKTVHPTQGEVVSIDCPVFVDGARARPFNIAPPLMGEHTEDIALKSALMRRRS